MPLYAVLGGLGWYFYGMLLNSLRLGKESVFHMTGEKVESIWVLNPFKNFFVVLTPFGLGTTAVIILLICLLTRIAITKILPNSMPPNMIAREESWRNPSRRVSRCCISSMI